MPNDTLRGSSGSRNVSYGPMTAIVVDNADPEGLGRVKLKYPWMEGDPLSGWARITSPMTGAKQGICFIPEIDDEVLVVFANGNINQPYVIGSLWHEKVTPPAANEDGKNNLRTIVSRSGLSITLDDTDSASKITISDKDQKNLISLDVASGTITINAASKLSITAPDGIELKTDAAFKLTANEVDITGNSKMALSAGSGNMTLDGMSVNINKGALEVK